MVKKRGITVLIIVLVIAGFSLLAYPTVSDYLNARRASGVIRSYTEAVSGLGDDEYNRLYAEAEAYNRRILERENPYTLTDSERAEYESLLNIGGDGVMGYIEIPAVNISLPICHDTEEATLQVAVGHVDWTSLPVGGASTHCVLSGHSGLPSAKLFTDISKLTEGDLFTLHVLGRELVYEVDRITVVLPEEVESLRVSPGEDYCTLVTCTPYGINTHRLLLRGHRVEIGTNG